MTQDYKTPFERGKEIFEDLKDLDVSYSTDIPKETRDELEEINDRWPSRSPQRKMSIEMEHNSGKHDTFEDLAELCVMKSSKWLRDGCERLAEKYKKEGQGTIQLQLIEDPDSVNLTEENDKFETLGKVARGAGNAYDAIQTYYSDIDGKLLITPDDDEKLDTEPVKYSIVGDALLRNLREVYNIQEVEKLTRNSKTIPSFNMQLQDVNLDEVEENHGDERLMKLIKDNGNDKLNLVQSKFSEVLSGYEGK